ncbi:MAG: hypothetical protein B0D96_13475 [Candidatus Sedimenticola endophacoides]|uniref:YbaK/aminoacyl-tRNA synthetase-associated domain-containing protein n=1 Tax=Candidatus Sedimenticola endophacoides TaxID=2548426 RepID=A0A6N4DL16_9GAMM|nr:MAG: hypothetical protein B0D94_04600 [Candidatus Sedimenticola endophacoides]OQX32567.1 MAG: hypothetical protein B0D96_13475 [Candidatus Sedimenticola endophacoides]OQX39271.1 MAG: hypothetical protein B0D89_11155 [Candidatus Sedimenticola endophacoides]OQX45115.1 MAG: hypothetical protein B0D88_01075 [Candidatus Sedimenticola endophacoides]PUD98561.1 MAG: hypothetical protein C3L24_12585 [Candidatus Sedimenticola endophacoides]
MHGLCHRRRGAYWCIAPQEHQCICGKKAKQETCKKIRMARAKEAGEVTGFSPGGVCPFEVEGAELLIDRGLSEYELICPAAGNDASGVPVIFDRLRECTDARIVDVMESVNLTQDEQD